MGEITREYSISISDANRCVICIGTNFPGDISKFKRSSVFNCQCEIYFHEECWNSYLKGGGSSCPYCRNNIIIPVQQDSPVIQEINIYCKILLAHYFLSLSIFYSLSIYRMCYFQNYIDYRQLYIGCSGAFLFFVKYLMFLWENIAHKTISGAIYGIFHVCIFVFLINSTLFLFLQKLDDIFLMIATLCWVPLVYVAVIFAILYRICYGCFYNI